MLILFTIKVGNKKIFLTRKYFMWKQGLESY